MNGEILPAILVLYDFPNILFFGGHFEILTVTLILDDF